MLISFLMGIGLWLWGKHSHILIEHSLRFQVSPAMTLQEFSLELENQHVISHHLLMYGYVRLYWDFSNIKSGTYQLSLQLSPAEIMHMVTEGLSERVQTFAVTIPEGFTNKQIAARLSRLGLGSSADILSYLQSSHEIIAGEESVESLEGYLYPETYIFFDRKPTIQNVVDRMLVQFRDMLPDHYIRDLKQRKFSLHQAVIFASLIEKETTWVSEKSKVSEVIWNRLRKNIPLGIDASIIYGISDYDGDLTFAHLKDASNPYNSRIHKGLPPSPIGAVTRSSLQAVLTPTNQGYFYYVLKSDGSGKHHFSKSLKEHNRFVRKLLQTSSP